MKNGMFKGAVTALTGLAFLVATASGGQASAAPGPSPTQTPVAVNGDHSTLSGGFFNGRNVHLYSFNIVYYDIWSDDGEGTYNHTCVLRTAEQIELKASGEKPTVPLLYSEFIDFRCNREVDWLRNFTYPDGIYRADDISLFSRADYGISLVADAVERTKDPTADIRID